MRKYEEALYDYIMGIVEETVDFYNRDAIINNTNEYIDIDSLFERTFCYMIVKFLLDSHMKFGDKKGDFKIELINDEGINSYDNIITGNIEDDEYHYKESFFTKILPTQYTQMFYKNMKFVDLCISNHILEIYDEILEAKVYGY